jgi:hypothetical protein
VLVFLFPAVLFSDFNNAFTVSAIFWWLLLVLSGDANGLIIIYFPLAFITALRGPLKGLGYLFDQFPTFYKYFRAILVWFESTAKEVTHFS